MIRPVARPWSRDRARAQVGVWQRDVERNIVRKANLMTACKNVPRRTRVSLGRWTVALAGLALAFFLAPRAAEPAAARTLAPLEVGVDDFGQAQRAEGAGNAQRARVGAGGLLQRTLVQDERHPVQQWQASGQECAVENLSHGAKNECFRPLVSSMFV